jgi:WD40 repeat protein
LHSVDISADGSVVAAGGEDGKVLVWNGQNGQLRLTLDIAPDGSITEPAKQ